jgi:hypothetical protein
VNQLVQSFKGAKTFVDNLVAQGTLTVTGLLTANGGVSATTLSSTGNISTVTGNISTTTGTVSAASISRQYRSI